MQDNTSTVTINETVIKDEEGDLSHIYCLCDENVALCGWDLTEADEAYDELSACIVCEELDASADFKCPQCNQ